MRLAWLLILLLFSAPAAAAGLKLEGQFIQGGLVIGKTLPGSRVWFNAFSIPVTKDGRFLIGFSRDNRRIAVLAVQTPNGAHERRRLKILKRDYKIQRIDGLPRRSVTPSPEDLKRIKIEAGFINRARASSSFATGFLSGFDWPVKGPVSGVYGSQRILNGEPRRPHFGVDVAAPEGAPIRAAADGTVVLTHPGMFFNGKIVIIDHGLGLSSTYIHMSKITVKAGDKISKGRIIGQVGQTGRATGPHLHWSVRLNKTELDPALLVGPMGK